MTLLLTHMRYGLLETIRIPIMVISIVVLPTLSFAFFALPNISDDPRDAALAALSLSVFAAMLICLFQFGVGVAEDRQAPWDPYVRTLPVAGWQRVGGRIMIAVPFVVGAIIPLGVLAALASNASLPPLRLLAGLGMLLVGSLPLALIGLAIGNALPSKAALAVANVLLLPLAYLGGLFLPPAFLPDVVAAISPFMPTRGWLELVTWAAMGGGADGTVHVTAILAWAAWLVLAAAATGWAYRRNETKQYR